MSEEGDFVALLLAKLRSDPGGSGWPDTCDYDERTRTARLTYRQPEGGSREVRLELPASGVRDFLDRLADENDVLDVWGPGVSLVEGAARFATIYLQERVATTRDDPLVIRY